MCSTPVATKHQVATKHHWKHCIISQSASDIKLFTVSLHVSIVECYPCITVYNGAMNAPQHNLNNNIELTSIRQINLFPIVYRIIILSLTISRLIWQRNGV